MSYAIPTPQELLDDHAARLNCIADKAIHRLLVELGKSWKGKRLRCDLGPGEQEVRGRIASPFQAKGWIVEFGEGDPRDNPHGYIYFEAP